MRIEFIQPQLSKGRLSGRAREYFGGDVQGFVLTKSRAHVYQVWQQPHRGDPRLAWEGVAVSARDFTRQLNRLAATAPGGAA